MATSSGILKDCTHITFNETIKSHNHVTFKLVKTGKLEIDFIWGGGRPPPQAKAETKERNNIQMNN